MMIINAINTIAHQLTPAQQQAILNYMTALLQEQEDEVKTQAAPQACGPVQAGTEPDTHVDTPASTENGDGHKNPPGWDEIKEIKGHFYVYPRWREGKTLRSKYLGKAKVREQF